MVARPAGPPGRRAAGPPGTGPGASLMALGAGFIRVRPAAGPGLALTKAYLVGRAVLPHDFAARPRPGWPAGGPGPRDRGASATQN